jgi:hypothetical protein
MRSSRCTYVEQAMAILFAMIMGHKQECLMVINLHVIRPSIKTIVAIIFSIIALTSSIEQSYCSVCHVPREFIGGRQSRSSS